MERVSDDLRLWLVCCPDAFLLLLFIKAKQMESSKSGFDRKYKVRVHGKLTPSKLDGLMRGLRVKGIKYM